MLTNGIHFLILLLIELLLFTTISQSQSTCSQKPNIIFIVADDVGWNDFSFHGSPQIPTPNIDSLALSGIILNNYYASPLCTPTRGAILTGKHPIHIRLQHYVVLGGMVDGLPLEEKLFPEYLKELGYATHLVGKWHLGHARRLYTPTFRGFDSHYGNWLGKQDHYSHFNKENLWNGYDLRRNMEVDYDGFGNYTTKLYTSEAIRLIENHQTESPLFLMINHIVAHTGNTDEPLQAPRKNTKKFSNSIRFIPRRIYAGMVDALDESVGKVIKALEKAGMLDNTIIVFTSDNGGSPEGHGDTYGSNWPLRGVKNSLWEGGTRVAGFIWSKLLPQRVSMDLMHVQDWLPTLYEAAGGYISNLLGIDGVSQWKTFEEGIPARTEFLYNIDDVYNNSAFRSGPWKVLQGNASNLDLGGTELWDSWYGPSGRSKRNSVHDLIPKIIKSTAGRALSRAGVIFNEAKMKIQQTEAEVKCKKPKESTKCDPYNTPCLFNIAKDPCEYNNLASEEPAILLKLLSVINEMNRTALEPLDLYNHPEADPQLWNNTWTNWKDYD